MYTSPDKSLVSYQKIKKMIANALGVVKRQILIRSADQKIKKDCKCTRCRKRTNLETIHK